ncbi:hypothetical protein [Kutzneria albida]|nr:hypothetical protein [Kutzneria albida]
MVLLGARATTALAAPAPVPGSPVDGCPPGSTVPVCTLPTVTTAPAAPPLVPSGLPTTTTTPGTPCTGLQCLPTTTPNTPPPPAGGEQVAGCGLGEWMADVGGCMGKAINSWFAGIVTAALHPLLDTLGTTLLSTPPLEALPQVGPLWQYSWGLVLAGYALLVTIGGILVMAHQSVQTRYSIREIAPRLLIALPAAALSLLIADQAVLLADALSQAILGQQIDPAAATGALANVLVAQALGSSNLFFLLLGLAVVALLVGILVTYVVRVVVTIILVIAAPLCLACHALPGLDGIARWWWRTFGAVLSIQLAQSLTLVVAIRVFLAPGNGGAG